MAPCTNLYQGGECEATYALAQKSVLLEAVITLHEVV